MAGAVLAATVSLAVGLSGCGSAPVDVAVAADPRRAACDGGRLADCMATELRSEREDAGAGSRRR